MSIKDMSIKDMSIKDMSIEDINDMNDMNIVTNDYDETELLSQGGYGCVYYPAIRCNKCETGKDCKTKFNKKKYVSKIQVLDNKSSEYSVSKLITQIPNFDIYFAPIVNLCNIDLSRINEEHVDTYGEKCGIIQKNKERKKKFVMLHIPYIKNGDFNNIIRKSLDNKTIFLFFINTYRHLIVALKLLLNSNIIHYDLKMENILYNNEKKVPIIIDFGLSLDFGNIIKKLKLKDGSLFIKNSDSKNVKYNKYKKGIIDNDIRSKLRKLFYVFAPDYYLWSLEITFISFLLHGNSEDESYYNSVERLNNGSYILTDDDVFKICHKYIYNNKGFAGFDDKFLSDYYKLSVKYYQQFVGLQGDEIIYNLIQYWWSWDNYSIGIMYLKLLLYTFDTNTNKTLNYLYEIILFTIHPNPNRRYLLTEIELLLYDIYYQGDTLQEIRDVFYNVNSSEHVKSNIKKSDNEMEKSKQTHLDKMKTTKFNVDINKL